MKAAVLDFQTQIGLTTEHVEQSLLLITGDGGSYAAMRRAQDYLNHMLIGNQETLQNIRPITEIWHKRSMSLNALATNHFGPSSCRDPSSLSRNTAAAEMKRPTNTKSCDFYPTSRSMTMYWEVQILDI